MFHISPEENQNFDIDTENMVTNYINEHRHLCTPNRHADLTNLNNTHYTTSEITRREVTNIIKGFKNNSPGTSKINK